MPPTMDLCNEDEGIARSDSDREGKRRRGEFVPNGGEDVIDLTLGTDTKPTTVTETCLEFPLAAVDDPAVAVKGNSKPQTEVMESNPSVLNDRFGMSSPHANISSAKSDTDNCCFWKVMLIAGASTMYHVEHGTQIELQKEFSGHFVFKAGATGPVFNCSKRAELADSQFQCDELSVQMELSTSALLAHGWSWGSWIARGSGQSLCLIDQSSRGLRLTLTSFGFVFLSGKTLDKAIVVKGGIVRSMSRKAAEFELALCQGVGGRKSGVGRKRAIKDYNAPSSNPIMEAAEACAMDESQYPAVNDPLPSVEEEAMQEFEASAKRLGVALEPGWQVGSSRRDGASTLNAPVFLSPNGDEYCSVSEVLQALKAARAFPAHSMSFSVECSERLANEFARDPRPSDQTLTELTRAIARREPSATKAKVEWWFREERRRHGWIGAELSRPSSQELQRACVPGSTKALVLAALEDAPMGLSVNEIVARTMRSGMADGRLDRDDGDLHRHVERALAVHKHVFLQVSKTPTRYALRSLVPVSTIPISDAEDVGDALASGFRARSSESAAAIISSGVKDMNPPISITLRDVAAAEDSVLSAEKLEVTSDEPECRQLDDIFPETGEAETQGEGEEEQEEAVLCDSLEQDSSIQAGHSADAVLEEPEERMIQQLVGEDSDAEEDSDLPATSSFDSERNGEPNDDEEVDEPVFASDAQANSCLPASVSFQYVQIPRGDEPDRLQVCVRRPLPDYWPDPRSGNYQAFLRAFFSGQARGAEGHDWSAEMQAMRVEGDGAGEGSALSVWQAAGYLHAQRVIESRKLPGCLFWWTPGSGKSIMVALLLELLFHTDLDVYVVSTPQNTRNNGLEECVRTLLRFSPVFNLGGREPTDAEVTSMVRAFRARPNGRPIYKKNFMSFRQFDNFCRQDGNQAALNKMAVIFDESHELFNDKMCDRAHMWGDVLERLSRGRGNKVFALSGTPGRNPAEMLLQVELVRRAKYREDHAGLLVGDAWQRRLAEYCAGIVSFVDGSRDLSRFPADAGVAQIECEMTEWQLHNFSTRCDGHLRYLGFRDFEHVANGLANAGTTRKIAVLSARLAQASAGVFWGGSKCGLQNKLETEPSLESIGLFAPKLRRLVEAILQPDGTPPLETKHFVYSDSGRTMRPLTLALRKVTVDGTTGARPHFKQLVASDFEWGRDGRLCLARPHQRLLDHPEQLAFVVLVGNAADRRKLLAAFGRITSDGVRHDGLVRPGGAPLVQALLGTQDSNQGLTLLRVQHVHLLEPPPKGWSEVIQAKGRAIRRETHLGLSGSMRQVRTSIYVAKAGAAVAELRTKQVQQLEVEVTQQVRDWEDARRRLNILGAAPPSQDNSLEAAAARRARAEAQAEVAGLVRATGETRQELENVRACRTLRVKTSSWSKRRQAFRTASVRMWPVLPDEAVYAASLREAEDRRRIDDVIRAASVHSLLLSEFHGEPTPVSEDRPMPWSAAWNGGGGEGTRNGQREADGNVRAAAAQVPLVQADVPRLLDLLSRPAPALAPAAMEDDLPHAAADDVLQAPQNRDELAAALRARVREQEAQHAAAAAVEAGGGDAGPGAECVACFERQQRGVTCGEGHFLCLDCVGMYVVAEGDDLYKLRRNEGRIGCPQRGAGCASEPFTHEYMQGKLSAEALGAYEGLQEKVRQMREVEAAAALPDGGGQAAPADAAAGGGEEAVLRLHVRHVEEELLTARCPRCRRAFADFDGCAALRCFGCGCGFCAWCLADCGSDAHAHIAACPESPAGSGADVAAAAAAFYAPERIVRDRASRRLRAYLGGLAPGMADKVRARIRHHLNDLGM